MGPTLQIVFDANDVSRFGRVLAAGTSRLPDTTQREASERGEFWIVMQDPEGNEFCLQ